MFKYLHESRVTPYAQMIQFIFLLLLLITIFGRDLNPFSNQIFLAHDETQAARLQQFNVNITQGNIPPRIAPDFSYGLGYPVFNYYAPFPYWISHIFQSVGVPLLSAMKLTYLLALVTGCVGMYLLLRRFFSFYPAVLGSFLYTSSPYIAVDILVRGNLGETWVFALFPLCLYLILTNTPKKICITSLVLSFLFTSHNILSLISLGIITVFVFFTSKKLTNAITVFAGLLLSSYFLIPAIAELSLVHATNIATKTQYQDHFLCLSQIWTATWGYAGSAAGCSADGMSFMLGKIPLLLGFTGIILFLYDQYIYRPNKYLPFINNLIKYIVNKINNIIHTYKSDPVLDRTELQRILLFFVIVTIGSIYMTLYSSAWLWQLFEPLLSLFQFPWRFLMFSLFGIALFSAYLLSKITRPMQMIGTIGMILIVFLIHPKYFSGQMVSYDEFTQTFLAKKYIANQVAYKVPEYLPTTASFTDWKSLEKNAGKLDSGGPIVNTQKTDILILEEKPFSTLFMARSKEPIIAQIHYAPYWKIIIDYIEYIPERFDTLGRPYIPVSDSGYTSVQIIYRQTTIEMLANLLSIVTLAILITYTAKQFTPSWNTIIKKT